MTKAQLETLFPIGTKVINLGNIKAIVTGYNEHIDGSCDLLLKEDTVCGWCKRIRWTADPKRCQPV